MSKNRASDLNRASDFVRGRVDVTAGEGATRPVYCARLTCARAVHRET